MNVIITTTIIFILYKGISYCPLALRITRDFYILAMSSEIPSYVPENTKMESSLTTGEVLSADHHVKSLESPIDFQCQDRTGNDCMCIVNNLTLARQQSG